MANAPSQVTWQSLRTLALAIVGAPVVILVAMYTVLGSQDGAFSPPLWALVAPAALGAASGALVGAVGYRTPAIDPATPPAEVAAVALPRFQTLMILRMALTEAVVILALALAFTVDRGGFAVVLVGVVVCEVLMWWHVVPNASQVRRVQRSLEARGAQVPLRQLLQAP